MRKRLICSIFVTGLLSLVNLCSLIPVSAASANLSHSYQSTSSIPNGSIVSLDPQHSNYVQLSDTNNDSRLLGVAVSSSDSLLAVDPSSSSVQVAISGSAPMLVSTLNGNIAVGDQISASPFGGVGMKAATGSVVIGLAQTSLNSKTAGVVTRQVKDIYGHTTTMTVGYIQADIAIGANSSGLASANLTSLQKLAKSITGKVISPTRVALSLAIVIIAILVLITLIYASIYSSLISIGRNPLAKHVIFRNLTGVLATASMVVVVAGVTVYFLLR